MSTETAASDMCRDQIVDDETLKQIHKASNAHL